MKVRLFLLILGFLLPHLAMAEGSPHTDYRVAEIDPANLKLPERAELDTARFSPEAVHTKLEAATRQPAGRVLLKPVKGLVEMRTIYSGEEIFRIGLRQGRLPEALYITGGTVTIDEVSQEYPQLAIREDQGRYLLRRPLVIGIGATLIIEGCTVKLSEEYGACLVNSGRLFVYDSELTGWRESSSGPAYYTGDRELFRPFFVSWGGSDTYFCQVNASHLGYFRTKSFGITFSSYQVKQGEEIFKRDDFDFHQPPTGWLIDSTFEDIYYGFYCYEAKDIVIVNNTYTGNIVYGIDPHDRSSGLVIAGNRVTGTKEKHGIIMSREVTDSFVTNNESYGNRISGIMLDRQCIRNEVAGNTVYDNGGDGISFYESGNNLIYGNTVLGNKAHGIRLRNSRNVSMIDNVIVGNGKFGVYLHTRNLSEMTRNLHLDPYEQAVSGFLYGGTVGYNASGSLFLSNYDRFTIFNVYIENKNRLKLRLGGDLKPYHHQVASSLAGAKAGLSLSRTGK